jgi:hypothetical protein
MFSVQVQRLSVGFSGLYVLCHSYLSFKKFSHVTKYFSFDFFQSIKKYKTGQQLCVRVLAHHV